ncbi:MAG: ECF transporter S component [Clostridiales bacterium]|nr:ECF transporter S component [Clostridiales bacterium]
MTKAKSFDTRQMVLLAMLTAVVVVLQFLGAFIRFGPFSISLVLMPIAVGAALIGVWAGAWLGLAFGLVVLLSGDAAVFLAIDPFGTIVVVLLKGALAGLAAGAAYKALAKAGKTVAAVTAAAVCPIVNTGIFILGTYVFFLPTIRSWGEAAGFASATAFIFVGMIGLNFVVELILNLVLSPVIIRLVQFGQDRAVKA